MRLLCPQNLYSHEPLLTTDTLAPPILKSLTHSNYPESRQSEGGFCLLLLAKKRVQHLNMETDPWTEHQPSSATSFLGWGQVTRLLWLIPPTSR